MAKDIKATFNIDLPMPDIDKIEAARGNGKGNGSVDVNINVTASGGKGGGSNALRDVAGHKVHESWFGAYGAIEDDTSKPIENLIGRLNDLANASDATGNKVKEASKAMALFETEFSPKKFERLTKSLQKTMSADEFKDAINGTGGGSKKGGKKSGGRRATPATPDIIPDGDMHSGGGNGGGRRQSGGGGGHPSADTIRYFKSIEELTEYLDGKGLRDTSTSINKFLSDLQSVPKNIRATFGRDGILTGVGLTAAGKKYGAAEIGKAAYRFSYKPDDNSYQLAAGGAQTQVYTDKIAKYEQAIAQKKKELVNTLTSIYNLPILQGTEKTNDLKAQLMQIVKETPNGLQLIGGDGMDQLNAAEEATKALQANIKAINAQVNKKWANNSLEKMDKNVEQMKTERARMVESFKKIGRFDTDDRFKAFDEALRNYEGKNPDINIANPETRVAQYNAMATAHERVARALQEETVAYNANNRAKQQSNKVDRADRVTLASYERKYQQMGGGKPQQMAEARAALKRYRNAQDDAEKKRAYDDLQENMRWMRDDLDARYRPEMERLRAEKQAQKEQNQKTANARKVFRSNLKKKDVEAVRTELAKMAQPYGGLESKDLPEYIAKALKQIDSVTGEKDLATRGLKLDSLKKMMVDVRKQDSRSKDMVEAAELLSKMNAESPMVSTQRDNLAAALQQVNGLSAESSANEVEDTWANLAAKIREATDAQKEYEKADAASNKQGTSLDTLIQQKSTAYEGYVKQLRTIQSAYEKMGKTLDTTTIDNLLNQFEATNVSDSDAMRMVKSKVSEELKRLGEMRSRDQNIFNAENQRTDITNNLNKWMDGLDIDESKLDKIKELKTALEELNKIDISADGGLAKFNQQLQNIGDIANAAKQQVEVIKRYKQVTGDKTYGILGHEHGTDAQRQESEALKKSLEDTYKQFLANPDDVAVMQQLNDQIMKMAAYLKEVEQVDAFGKMNEQVASLDSKMQAFISKHGDTSKWGIGQQQVAQAFKDTMSKYDQQVKAGDLAGAKESFAALDGQVKALNSSFESGGGLVGVFDGKLSKLVGRLLGLGSGFMAVQKVIGTFKKMASYVTQIDTAMTELKKVTDESATAYERFQKQSGKTAVQIGSSIKDLINTTVEYGRMGYSLAESQQLGVVTTKFANTGNFSGVTDASDALISIIRGFDNLDVGDAEMISDKLTAVANNYAVTASDIAEGLQRSASALNLGGVSLDQATAMITAVAEVTRDAGGAGNAIKVMSMRLRGAKTELAAAGEETDGMAESTSKLRAQVAALTNVNGQGGFDIMQDEDTFKSVYDIMLGISKVWGEMTDVKQSALLELMAGKVRANQVAALLNNMSRAEEILKTSEESEGTADEVHAKWLDSIVAKQQQLTASWENLSQTVMNSDMIKGFYSAGSDILNILEKIISAVGAFGPAFTAVGTGLLGKLGGGNALTGFLDLFQKNTGAVRGDFIKQYNEAFWQTNDKTIATGQAIKAMQESVGGAGFEMNKAEKFAIQYSKGIVDVGNGATIASMKLQALGAVMKSIGANLLVMAAMAAISYGMKAIADAWDQAAHVEEHAVQAADDAEAEYKEATAQVQSLEEELENTQKQYDELVAKGPLNFADEQTKNDLKEQTEELKTQLELAKQIEAAKGKAAYSTRKEAWQSEYSLNQSLPFVISNANTLGGGKLFVEATRGEYSPNYDAWDLGGVASGRQNRIKRSAEEVGKQIKQYVDKGFVANDVEGSMAMYNYLSEIKAEAIDVLGELSSDATTPEQTLSEYRNVITSAEASLDSLEVELRSVYSDLNNNLNMMREHGDEADDIFSHMLNLRNMIGDAFLPDLHANQKLLDLRKTDAGFDRTYKKLEKLAETTEITNDLLNGSEYDAFRNQLIANGISIDNLIAKLNELRVAVADVSSISTTTASGLATSIGNLLGYRSTGAGIMKNTGYGTPISEEDYQKLVDMNDRDLLKAVEYSHGTAFFNQQKFNDMISSKLGEEYDKMYDDMIAKQDEYVKKTSDLNEMLRKYYVERNKDVKNMTDEQYKQHQESLRYYQNELLALSKNMTQLRSDIDLYNRLGMQIKDASSAFAKWQLTQSAPQEGDFYDQALEAYKDLEEGFKSGRIGNAAYKAAQEYLLDTGGNYYGNEKQRKMLERYLNKSNPNEKDSTDTGWGARNFQKDLIEKGILNNDGSLKGDWFIEDIANAMGMGADLIEHMFGELNEFIADEEKKYKLASKNLEDTAQSQQYDSYIEAKKAYEDATAEYAKQQDESSMKKLLQARLDYLKASGEIGLDEYSTATDELKMSNDEVVSALNTVNASLNALTAALMATGMPNGMAPGYDPKTKQYYLNGADGEELIRGTYEDVINYISKLKNVVDDTGESFESINKAAESTGNKLSFDAQKQKFIVTDMFGKNTEYDTNVDAITALFDDSLKRATALVQEINEFAAAHGIDKQVTRGEDGQWYVGKTGYTDLNAVMTAMFSGYTDKQSALITDLTNAVVALTGNDDDTLGLGAKLESSMEASGATFGEKAIASWEAQLDAAGIKERFGINENGELTFGDQVFSKLTDALEAAFGDLFTLRPEQGLETINDTIRAYGSNTKAEYKNGEYILTGDVEGRYADATSAMAAISEKGVVALQETYKNLNDTLTQFSLSIQEGQTTITETATGEKTQIESLASGIETVTSQAHQNLESVVAKINALNTTYGDTGIQAAIVNRALTNLGSTLEKGGADVSKGLDALNKALSLEGISDKIGVNENGEFTFAGEIFSTVETLLAKIASMFDETPATAERVVNNILKSLGRVEDTFKFNGESYVLTDKNGQETVYKSMQEALGDLTGGSLSNLSDVISALNEAYAAAGETIRASITEGKSTLRDIITGEVTQAKEDIDEHIKTQAAALSTELSGVLDGIKQIELKVTADGKITLVGADGKPVLDANGKEQTFDSLSSAITVGLGDNFTTLNESLAGLSDVLGGLTIDNEGIVNGVSKELAPVVAKAVTDISAVELAKMLGGVSIEPDGKKIFNGKTYDTFADIIKDQFNASNIKNALDEDAGAFNKNKTAVEGATSALAQFNAALAASSITKMLEQTGNGGHVEAGENGVLNYFGQTGALEGTFGSPEEAYRHLFPEFGKWQYEMGPDGKLKATKKNERLKEGEKLVEGLDTFSEIIDKIDKITIDQNGQGRINDFYDFSGGFKVGQNGELIVEANGSELNLGNVQQVTSNGTSSMLTTGDGTTIQVPGVYAKGENGLVKRPEYDAVSKIIHGVGDNKSIEELLRYAEAAGEQADSYTKAAVYAIKKAVDEDITGKLYDALSGEFGDTFGLTDTARQKEEAKKAEERRIQEEAKRQERAQKSQTTQLKNALDSGKITYDEFEQLVGQMYDLGAVAKKFNLKDADAFDVADLINIIDSIDDILGAEGLLSTDVDYSQILAGIREQAAKKKKEEEEAAAAEAARIAAETEARNKRWEATRKQVQEDSANALGIIGAEVYGRVVTNGINPIIEAVTPRVQEDVNALITSPLEAAASQAKDIWDKASETMGDLSDKTQEARENATKTVTDLSNQAASGIANSWYAIEDAATAIWDFFTKDAPRNEEPKEKPKSEVVTIGAFGENKPMEYYARGNVDLYNRKLISTKVLEEAGWGEWIDGDGIATMFSSNYQGAIDGEDYILHVTPILPDGSVLSPDDLDDYVMGLFDLRDETGINILSLDNPENSYGGKGIVTWLQEVIGDLEEAQRLADEFDAGLSRTQGEYYGTDTAWGIWEAYENLPDYFDQAQALQDTVAHIKDLYDFDKFRQLFKGGSAANADDETVTRLLVSMGDQAEEYRRQISEEPAEIPVDADTSAAASKIDALGNMNQTVTVTANVVYNDPGFNTQQAANGTENAKGGTSLVDEEGAELIEHVSRGTYELGTDNGPRFTQLDKGDIVHTAEETKKIQRRGLLGRVADAFRNGGVKIGGAFRVAQDSGGSAKKIIGVLKEVSGGGTIVTDGSGSTLAGANNKKKSSGGGKNSGTGLKNALKWAESLVDWIPTALENLKKKTTEYIRAAEKAVGYLARNSDLTKAIENVRAEIQLTQRAAERYEKQANEFATRSGLAADIITKIKEGTIDIEEYDENTRKAIQTYQTWWDKAKGCNDTLDSLNDQLYDLSKQKLDNIIDYFGNINDMLEQQIETYNSMIKVKEAYGQEMTRTDYLDAIMLTQQVIENLSKEQKTLQDELDYQVNSGVIKVGSDDWYNYAKQIEEVTSTINDAKVELSDLNDEVKGITINNLKTSIYYLDNLQNRIEGLQKLRDVQNEFNTDINSYRVLISNGMKQIDNLEQQNEQLRQQMEGLDVLSEKYHELYQQLQENESTILNIKTNQEEWNDAIIDLKIDMLEKQNEKYQQQMNLMKALNELEDARQRKVLMYSNEDGFKYVADEDELESAQDTVNEQIHDLIVRGLEQQKYQNNIYDNMGNQLIPVTDMLAGIDFSRYYDSINRGSETSALLTSILSNIDIPDILSKTAGGDVSIDIGDIILNGVNDAQSLGDAIIAQLPGYLVQAIYSKNT